MPEWARRPQNRTCAWRALWALRVLWVFSGLCVFCGFFKIVGPLDSASFVGCDVEVRMVQTNLSVAHVFRLVPTSQDMNVGRGGLYHQGPIQFPRRLGVIHVAQDGEGVLGRAGLLGDGGLGIALRPHPVSLASPTLPYATSRLPHCLFGVLCFIPHLACSTRGNDRMLCLPPLLASIACLRACLLCLLCLPLCSACSACSACAYFACLSPAPCLSACSVCSEFCVTVTNCSACSACPA